MSSSRKTIVLLGMMTKIPVSGVVWQTVHYLEGLRRLGYDVRYVEAHARTPSMFMEREGDDGSGRAAAFIDNVMRRFEMPMPSPSAAMSKASRTASKLYSGSPIPIITMFVMHRSPLGTTPSVGRVPPGQSPRLSRAANTWPTISPAVRLRTSRCVPVWQNVQLSVQPTWLDKHSVPRSVSGM